MTGNEFSGSSHKEHAITKANRRTFLKEAGALAASAMAAKTARAEEPRDVEPDHGASHAPAKPKPINTGPSQAEGIAAFASRARYEDLTAERLKARRADHSDLAMEGPTVRRKSNCMIG